MGAAGLSRPLLDHFLPDYEVRTRHAVRIDAPVEAVMAAGKGLDLRDSRLIRVLFRLRGIPASDLTLDGLRHLGFLHLGERADELVLGVVGKFWTPSGHLVELSPDEFRSFRRPGYAKAAFNFLVSPVGDDAAELTTETRVATTSGSLRFRLYWLLVAPFSGWIRREMLRLIKARAEAVPR